MPTQNELLIKLKTLIYDILGPDEDGIDELGMFEFISNGTVINTAPSIRIGFPLDTENQPIIRMKKDSGIQCVIDKEITPQYHKQGNRLIRKHHTYCIYLDQYNPYKGLTDALDALVRMPRLLFKGDPIVTPSRIDANGGVLPPRAILYVERITISSSYW